MCSNSIHSYVSGQGVPAFCGKTVRLFHEEKRRWRSAFAFSPIRCFSSCTLREIFISLTVPCLQQRNVNQPGPFATSRACLPQRSPALGGVPPHYQRFFTHTDPAATLWPSTLLPTSTFLQGLSPRGQEGFTSSSTTPPYVPPSLPRRVHVSVSARLSDTGAAFASTREARHPVRCISRGLLNVRYLRPARSLPGLSPGLSGGSALASRLKSVSSAS